MNLYRHKRHGTPVVFFLNAIIDPASRVRQRFQPACNTYAVKGLTHDHLA